MADAWWATTVATALGGFIAGLAGWLNNWGQAKRERRRDADAARREAYGNFLHSADLLYGIVEGGLDEINSSFLAESKSLSEAKRSELRLQLDKAGDNYLHAKSVLYVTAPVKVADAARGVSSELEDLFNKFEDVLDDVSSARKNWEHGLRKEMYDLVDKTWAADDGDAFQALTQLMRKDLDA